MKTKKAQDSPGEPITGDRLIDALAAKQRAAGKKGDPKNARSALRGFLASCGKALSDLVGGEFNRASIIEYATTRAGKSSKANTRSLLLALHMCCLEMQKAMGLPEKFGERFLALREAAHLSRTDVAKAIGRSKETIYAWEHGTPPLRTKIEAFTKAETLFNAPPGSLSQCLGAYARQDMLPVGQTDFGAKVRRLAAEEFRYRFPFKTWQERAPWLIEPIHGLRDFKTSDHLGELQRTEAWRVREDGRCVTFERFLQLAESFFGFLLLPPSDNLEMNGMGMAVEDLSLALFGVPDLVYGWLQMARARAGCYTNDADHILKQVKSLVRPGTGYLAQKIEFADARYFAGKFAAAPDKLAAWEAHCRQAHGEFNRIQKSIAPKIVKGRDPEEPIRPILRSPRPMEALFLLAELMEADLGRYDHPMERAAAYRNLLLIEMLTSNPLRIGMYCRMRWTPDNTGNLYQREDGTWRVRFKARDFKNSKGKSKEDYDVPVAAHLYGRIETYIKVHRPLLAGANTAYLFRPVRRGNAKVYALSPMREITLGNVVRRVTRRYLPNCPGFGPHAFRHIIATHLVKCYPVGGCEYAAYVLRDTLETIIAAYGHLREEDKVAAWLHLLTTIQATYATGDEAPQPTVDTLLEGLPTGIKAKPIKGNAHAKR